MIRHAVEQDIPRLIELGMRFGTQSEYRDMINTNEEALLDMFHTTIGLEDGVWLVTESDGVIVGMIGMLVYPHHFSGERTAIELAWWVEPEHRQGRHGIALLKAAEEWARERKAVALQMIAPNEAIESIYSRLGYRPVERSFQKKL